MTKKKKSRELVLPYGVRSFSVDDSMKRRLIISEISTRLEAMGYRYLEIPLLSKIEVFDSCTAGTENRMITVGDDLVLIPEVTNYVRALGARTIGCNKIYYVTRCFRNETTTDATRLREFTQIGVEMLGENSLDCRKIVRKDALTLFQAMISVNNRQWVFEDGVERGLNLYNDSSKTFEIQEGMFGGRQILGGGPYDGGAGWALGLERLMAVTNRPH